MRAADLHRLARTLRAIALDATGNTGADRVNPGELAVLEDVARHPDATIRDVTTRTGLAQSLVSRITRQMADAGVLAVASDTTDKRKVRIRMTVETRAAMLDRAGNTIAEALTRHTQGLSEAEREELTAHLVAAHELLRRGDPQRQ